MRRWVGQRSSKKQDSGGLCRGARVLPKGSGKMLNRVKAENDLFSPKGEMLPESNSRTLSSAIAHAGEKTFFSQTKEMPFPSSPLPHLALAGTPGPQPLLSNPFPACLPNGSPALCRGQVGLQGGESGFSLPCNLWVRAVSSMGIVHSEGTLAIR